MNRRALVAAAVVVATLGVVLATVVWRTSTPPAAETAAPPPAALPASAVSSAVSSASPAGPGAGESSGGEPVDPAAADASPGETPYSQTAAARAQWEPVVRGFATNFSRRAAADQTWVGRLAPYATTAVQEQLAAAGRGDVPPGRYRSYRPLSYYEEQLVVRVSYREGWTLTLSLISDGETWHVYQFHRAN